MAIILLHNIEHFNLYNFPEATTDFMKALDKGVWDTLFFLFSGKAYAIFALLFGFSFFIQFDNQARKGKDFRLRFFWRLVLLFFIGCFNASFFPGEILVLYSILGIVLIPVCKLSNKVVLAIAVVLMLQPMEWGKFMYALMHPEYVASKEQWLVHCMRIYPYMEGDLSGRGGPSAYHPRCTVCGSIRIWKVPAFGKWSSPICGTGSCIAFSGLGAMDVSSRHRLSLCWACCWDARDCLSIWRSTGRFGQGPLLSG